VCACVCAVCVCTVYVIVPMSLSFVVSAGAFVQSTAWGDSPPARIYDPFMCRVGR